MAQASEVAVDRHTVVFVCEHGSVKSVMAAALFNASAKERNLDLRAVARGTQPDDQVPARVAKHLKQEGVNIEEFKPRSVSEPELSAALRVVAIDVPRGQLQSSRGIDHWEGIPSSSDYMAARSALNQRVQELQFELDSSRREQRRTQ